MQLKLFRHLWGVDLPLDQAMAKIAAEGFVGVETRVPEPAQASLFQDLRARHNLDFIALTFTGGQSVDEHLASLQRGLQQAQAAGATQVTCQSGSDAWSDDEARAFYAQATAIERSLNLAVGHETHRSRYLFNPWNARKLLEFNDAVRLCCDLSHWVCVTERLLQDCDDIIDLCAQRCIHVHARVGYEHGPQVPDPAAAEYQRHLTAHERWWDRIWDAQVNRGLAHSTLTPEFGPPGYLHTLPHTNVPVADLWKVCTFMADRQARRFAERYPSA